MKIPVQRDNGSIGFLKHDSARHYAEDALYRPEKLRAILEAEPKPPKAPKKHIRRTDKLAIIFKRAWVKLQDSTGDLDDDSIVKQTVERFDEPTEYEARILKQVRDLIP